MFLSFRRKRETKETDRRQIKVWQRRETRFYCFCLREIQIKAVREIRSVRSLWSQSDFLKKRKGSYFEILFKLKRPENIMFWSRASVEKWWWWWWLIGAHRHMKKNTWKIRISKETTTTGAQDEPQERTCNRRRNKASSSSELTLEQMNEPRDSATAVHCLVHAALKSDSSPKWDLQALLSSKWSDVSRPPALFVMVTM